MEDKHISKSLFGDDVRHSVETVEERWQRERRRRVRLMAMICVPLAVVLLGGWLVAAWHFKAFPFASKSGQPGETTAENGEKPHYSSKFGYEGARLKIINVFSGMTPTPDEIDEVYGMLIDDYPSEVYLESWDLKNLPPDMRALFPSEMHIGFLINGSHVFTYTDENGETQTYDSITNSALDCDGIKFGCIFNSEYKRIYNTDKNAVDVQIFIDRRDKRKKAIDDAKLPEIKTGEDLEYEDEVEEKTDGGGEEPGKDSIVLPKLKFEGAK